MAVSKRLRFEILRRDGFSCRYCGASSDETKLVVDHVLPESLGGKTEPANLVAACQDCNSGKASTHPDDQVVEDVAAHAAVWKAAMEQAAAELNGHAEELQRSLAHFDALWSSWTNSEGVLQRPRDWAQSVETFLSAGLSMAKLEELLAVTMNSKVKNANCWRYFCGCAWRTVDQIRDRAAQIVENADVLPVDWQPTDHLADVYAEPWAED